MSFRRKPESSQIKWFWTPAFAGVTAWGTFYEAVNFRHLYYGSITGSLRSSSIARAAEAAASGKTRSRSRMCRRLSAVLRTSMARSPSSISATETTLSHDYPAAQAYITAAGFR